MKLTVVLLVKPSIDNSMRLPNTAGTNAVFSGRQIYNIKSFQNCHNFDGLDISIPSHESNLRK